MNSVVQQLVTRPQVRSLIFLRQGNNHPAMEETKHLFDAPKVQGNNHPAMEGAKNLFDAQKVQGNNHSALEEAKNLFNALKVGSVATQPSNSWMANTKPKILPPSNSLKNSLNHLESLPITLFNPLIIKETTPVQQLINSLQILFQFPSKSLELYLNSILEIFLGFPNLSPLCLSLFRLHIPNLYVERTLFLPLVNFGNH